MLDDPLAIGIFAMLFLIFMLMTGIWIAIAMGLVGLLALYFFGASPALVSYMPFTVSESFVMTAIPLFIFMGEILKYCGAADMIYRGASKWLAWVPGGLLHANIGASALFAAISGSSAATAATIGTMAIKSLRERNYDEQISLGSLAAGGTLGILIPPSITMIVYGYIGEVSVGRLFAGGIIPGLLLSAMFMTYIAVKALRNPDLTPKEAAFSVRGLASGFLELWPLFVLMLVILGGIFTGFASPTEAAALGASSALLISLILRKLTWSNLLDSVRGAARVTCMLMFIIIGGTMVGSALGRLGTAKALAAFITGMQVPLVWVIIGVVIFYLVMTCFVDGLSLIIITTPVLLPALLELGIDPVWYGVLLVVLVEMGLLTPPVGLNLYVIQGVAHAKFTTVVKGTMPFFFVQMVGLVLIIAFPTIVLWLPSLIFRS